MSFQLAVLAPVPVGVAVPPCHGGYKSPSGTGNPNKPLSPLSYLAHDSCRLFVLFFKSQQQEGNTEKRAEGLPNQQPCPVLAVTQTSRSAI